MTLLPLRVLLVEDQEDDAELILVALRQAGYAPQCRRVQTQPELVEALRSGSWDVILSDCNLPSFDAANALQIVKAFGLDLPFVVVSGAIGEETAVAFMKAGAHDYVMKGNLPRLAPAIERELRDAAERAARRLAEQALADSEERYRTIVDAAHDTILLVDADWCISFANRRAPDMLGYACDQLIGLPFSTLIDLADRDEWGLRLRQIHQGGAFELDLRLRRSDGRDIWATSSCTRLPAANGAFGGAIVMLKDVTERRLAAEALRHQALHDALTGLPNRTLLQDRLQQAVFSARRENRRIAVLLIDLDRFKDVNDAFGHHYGDLLLKEVGDRLQHALRESDTVARLGGDEFAVILSSCLEVEDAKLAAVKILKALDEPFIIEQQNLRVAGSIGVVVHPDHGEDVNTLLRRADVAMYAAKREGDGYSMHGTDQEEASASRLKLSAQLRDGIRLGELELYYQPKVGLRTRELKGVEALVRWNHPEQGLVVPDAFIPLAEQTGLIKPLSRWVVETALHQWREWHRRGLELTVAFNLSMRNLHDPHLPDMLEELLQGFHLPPGALQAEITETVLMTNATRTLDVVTRLSNLGVQLSIDDFGTGYSSLAYLKRLPVRELKIDKSFVHDMAANENDMVIVRSTIDLGHSLDMKVTAEGVETPEAWDRLDALGCDLAQGYYMARPMPVAAFESWVGRGIYVPNPRPTAVA